MMRNKILWMIVALSAITRLVLILMPQTVWWDTSIYVGMAKYFYSFGHIGYWESLRPPLWPLFIGIFFKMGLPIMPSLKILELLISCAFVILLYVYGEKIEKNVGLYASLLFSFTPFVFFFTSIPLTDVPSAFIGYSALFLTLRGRFVSAGLVASVAFLTRFPMGLFLIIIGLFILIASTTWKERIISGLKTLAGFLILTLPYLIINYFYYGDALRPIKDGGFFVNNTIEENVHGYAYYFVELAKQNPLLIFALVGLVIFVMNYKKMRASKELLMMFVVMVIAGGYFSYIPHKELRYCTPFLPALALFAGYGITQLSAKIPRWSWRPITTGVVLIVLIIPPFFAGPYGAPSAFMSDRFDYYTYLADKPGATLITTSPQMTVFTNTSIVGISETWENMDKIVTQQPAEYVAFNDCELMCENTGTCQNSQTHLASFLNTKKIVYSKTIPNSCNLKIYSVIQ